MRDALVAEVAVIIDGRDKENLAEQEEEKVGEDEPSLVEHVKVTKRVSDDTGEALGLTRSSPAGPATNCR